MLKKGKIVQVAICLNIQYNLYLQIIQNEIYRLSVARKNRILYQFIIMLSNVFVMMPRIFKLSLCLLAFVGATVAKANTVDCTKVYPVSTEKTTLVYTVGEDNRLIFRYYGPKIHNTDQFRQIKGYPRPDCNREANYEAYPSFGLGYVNEPAISAVNADGSLITELSFGDYEETRTGNVHHSIFTLKDRISNLLVRLHVEAYQEEDVITQYAEIVNEGKKDMTLKNFYSSFLNFRANDYYLTHFYGTWAGEMNRVEERLEPGIKTIESKKGIRTTQSENASFILSFDQPVRETNGVCVGGALAWSGNYKLSFEVDEREHLNILCGMNPFLSDYHLAEGEMLETPKMIYTFSVDGQGTISRNFHDWARKYSLHNGYSERPILLNSWEGAYFDFDEKKITDMIDDW